MTCVTANNRCPRSVIFLSFSHSRDSDFHNFSSPGFLMQKMTDLREPLAIRLIIGLDFAVTLSSLDSFCVLFDITSGHSAELKWANVEQTQQMIPFVHV